MAGIENYVQEFTWEKSENETRGIYREREKERKSGFEKSFRVKSSYHESMYHGGPVESPCDGYRCIHYALIMLGQGVSPPFPIFEKLP